MPRVKITGLITYQVAQYLDVPDDELEELLGDEENMIANLNEGEMDQEAIDWSQMMATVVP